MNCEQCNMINSKSICVSCKHNNIMYYIKTNRLKIYGITGRAGSGKSTLAKYIKNQSVDVQIIPFAAKVKYFATLMGWNGEKDEKGRRLLQLLGTECGRECIDDDIWIDYWFETISNRSTPRMFIADDVRFNNEAEAIKTLGGKIIKLTGRNMGLDKSHPSEQGINNDLVDIRINNQGSIAALRKEAAKYADSTRWI